MSFFAQSASRWEVGHKSVVYHDWPEGVITTLRRHDYIASMGKFNILLLLFI
jgi:hypothetical protein